MVKSSVRIYGPPLLKAIRALEGVAVEMSNKTRLKFSHKCIPYPTRLQSDRNDWESYLKNLQKTYQDCYEPEKIISDASMTLGEYDFVFEWSEKPNLDQVQELIEKIDEALAKVGVLYTITTE
ncbi:MAG TPA: hypothetical protein ENF19_00450, partial [Candidatus Bathyarchaeota archaeon]|nr:hypothetical protein [Candidatus Bathyarchaeota archaeon]